MSTVLWGNILLEGIVKSDESDKYALYKHSKKLNKISKELNVVNFESIQDFTDMEFNLSQKELPEGMKSTNELMAKNGVWASGAEAVEMFEKMIEHISSKNVKFGLFTNDFENVISELKESLLLANKAKRSNGKFNFSVVM